MAHGLDMEYGLIDGQAEEWGSGVSQEPAGDGWEAQREDAVLFARESLGFEPDELQQQILRGGKRGILNCSRQWGKSTVAAIKALHYAVFRPSAMVLVAAPSERQSGEFLLRVRELAARIGMTDVRGDGVNQLSLRFARGNRVVALPARQETVRGFSADLLIVDEAAMLPDRVFAALSPSLAARDGDLWLLSTPNGQEGFFWKCWTGGGEEWLKIKAPAEGCGRIRREFLETERLHMSEREYLQNYCCEFTDREDAVFSAKSVYAMFTDSERAEEL